MRVLRRLFVLAVVAATIMTFTPGVALAGPGDVVRGTAVADMPLYEAQDASADAVGSIYAGTTLQALDMGEGWYAASFGGLVRYFFGADALVLYTADSSDVMHGVVVGGTLGVLAVPSPSGAVSYTFAEGATIQFCAFNSSYYMARLSDGSICYIDAAQVRLYAPTESGTLTRWASASGARVFAAPDEGSTVLTTFEAGTRLYFADFDADWLMASMSVDGSTRTVFVSKSEVLTEEPQPKPTPTPDPEPTPAQTTWIITTDATAGYESASWDAAELEEFRKGAVLTAAAASDGWYRITYNGQTMYLASDAVKEIPASNRAVTYRSYDVTLGEAVSIQNTGTWIVGSDTSSRATVDELRTYMDPANFPEGTSGFFQFLVLTQPMGVSVSALDAELEGKGTLEGMGQAFSDAAYAYGVNELYLISHALHETGNGWSTLAQGVWYDPATETASKEKVNDTDVLVYNMYGIGAVDSNPLNGGAKRACEEGWTTPYKAVVGGAEFIAGTYLYAGSNTLSGQNTLYKMLYHPEWVERYGEKPWHEYATDVAWANAQTYFYTRMLADFDNYSLVFEVPVYAGE